MYYCGTGSSVVACGLWLVVRFVVYGRCSTVGSKCTVCIVVVRLVSRVRCRCRRSAGFIGDLKREWMKKSIR